MTYKNWKRCTLGDVVTFQRGHDLPVKETTGGIYPVVGSNGIIAYHNQFTTSRPCLTIGRSGNVGGVHFFNMDCWAHNTTLYAKEFKGIDPKFLYYYLKTLRLVEYRSGSAVPTLNRNHIHPIEICIPESLLEQEKITLMLSVLDEKIELNNRMNKVLEEMAQAIFKRWFVDFEFPNESGEPYKSSDGKMGWCEELKKEIPKGWEVQVLPQVADIIDCLHSKKPDRQKEGRVLLQVWNIAEAGKLDMSDKYLISEEDYQKWISRIEVKEGDCVITNVGRVGAVAQIPSKYKFAVGRNMTAVRPHINKISPTFLLEYLLSEEMRKEINSKMDTGTILDSLNVKGIMKLRIILPPFTVIEAFENIVRPIRKKIEDNIKLNFLLSNLRDTLLHKLMSGEIDVSQVEL